MKIYDMKNIKNVFIHKMPFVIGFLIAFNNVAYGQTKNVFDNNDSVSVKNKINIATKNIHNAHRENMYIVKFAAYHYIKKHIIDEKMSKFMLDCILTDGYDYYWDCTTILNPYAKDMISDIKKDYKWFDNLMKYLSGKCSDKALYDSGFFQSVQEPTNGFVTNMYVIERCSGFIDRNKNNTISFYDGR